MSKPGRGSDQFPLRLPDGMRAQIKEAAEKSGRSMNAEIVHRLETSLMTGGISPVDFLSFQEFESENAQKLAAALRRIAHSVELLGSGSLELLGDNPEDMK